MTSFKIISFCCALFLAGCSGAGSEGAASGEAVVLNAKTVVTYQRSLSAMESGMDDAHKAELSRAINAIIMFPESGDCALEARLKHAEKFKDPAFRQRIQFDRLHGLTAEQILSLGEARKCGLDEEAKPGSEPEAQTSLNELNEVTVFADPYMSTNNKPQYAILIISCVPEGKTRWKFPIAVSVLDLSAPPKKLENGTVIHQFSEGDFLKGRSGHFFQRGDVFFDGVKIDIPSIYEKIEKKVLTGPDSFEMREERILIGPDKAYELLLSELRTAKSMRLKYRSGVGPSFDLTQIRSDIEALEAQCPVQDTGE